MYGFRGMGVAKYPGLGRFPRKNTAGIFSAGFNNVVPLATCSCEGGAHMEPVDLALVKSDFTCNLINMQ